MRLSAAASRARNLGQGRGHVMSDCCLGSTTHSFIMRQKPLRGIASNHCTAPTPPFGRAMFPATAGSSFPSTVAKLMSPHSRLVAAWQGKQGRRNIAISGGNDEVLYVTSIDNRNTNGARSLCYSGYSARTGFFSRVSSLRAD